MVEETVLVLRPLAQNLSLHSVRVSFLVLEQRNILAANPTQSVASVTNSNWILLFCGYWKNANNA